MKTKLLCAALALAAVPLSARADDATTTKRDRVAVSTTHTTSASRWNGFSDHADDDADMRREVLNKHFTLAPVLGWASDGYGAAVGGRFGYTFDVPVYVGASFVYQTGERSTSASLYPSGELGYDLGIGNVLLRPYGGAGALARQGGASTGLVYPGLTAEWLIPRSYAFLGGDARVLFPFDDVPALSLMGTAGLNF